MVPNGFKDIFIFNEKLFSILLIRRMFLLSLFDNKNNWTIINNYSKTILYIFQLLIIIPFVVLHCNISFIFFFFVFFTIFTPSTKSLWSSAFIGFSFEKHILGIFRSTHEHMYTHLQKTYPSTHEYIYIIFANIPQHIIIYEFNIYPIIK